MHFPVVPLYAFSNNLVYKNIWVDEPATFQPAETTVRLQIACFHLQTHRKWSRAQRRISKLRLSLQLICLSDFLSPLWQGHHYLHIYLHISRATQWHFTVWYSIAFWTCSFPSNEAKQRYFFCACVRELLFLHTHTHSLSVCPSN